MDASLGIQGFKPTARWATVERFLAARHAPATRALYRSSTRKFARWCRDQGLPALPAEPRTLAMFLAAEGEAGKAPTTIARHVAAIRKAHLDGGYPDPSSDPVIKALKQGIRRASPRSRRPKDALSLSELHRLADATGDDLAGLRDRAILLLGFAAALRRSEIASLCVEDIEETPEGLIVALRRSKTDQEGTGQRVTVSGPLLAPLQGALAAWRMAAGIEAGALFRRLRRGGNVTESPLTPHAVGRVIKARAAEAGLNPATLGAHSLRSGRITEEAAQGASPWELMHLSRHKSIRSLQDYVHI